MSPIRDEFAEEIARRLGSQIDPRVFEACACDLLRDVFPSLAPVPGGSDAGMDGAIADGLGPPIPLVATTNESVIENLTGSLESYLRNGGQRRKVVVATSQELTPRQVRNLEDRARKLDFSLLGVYQRAAWVDRLYHSPRWCAELLGLAAAPSALAPVPSGRRPLVEAPLIGQEAALAWMRETTGDRILAGPPGAGKTYLLFQLAKEGFGLFLESDDPSKVLENLRRYEPKVIIVDDAHVHLSRLALLRALRRQNPALPFDIVATSWESHDQDAVTRELGSGSSFTLEPLPRDQMVEIVKQCGIFGPPQLIREIVDQAANRPGLAVTLAVLCLQGSAREVFQGSALSNDIVGQLEARLGHEAADALAVLALGGRHGMPVQVAADYLRLGPGEVRHLLAHLAPAGVISTQGDYTVVRPRALRFALVRDYFFPLQQGGFDLERVLSHAPSMEDE